MSEPRFCTLLLLCGILFASPVVAFGAGNIASVAKIEGTNWRHGDIEDTLLSLLIAKVAGGKKFNKINVSRVYFGNWLRDYSQAIDVGTVKYVSAEAIRIILWVLGFMTFGYGTKEFEVTAERLGCYRPEDHIDNPKDYADNVDATQFDARLRGPVNERIELAIDPRTGMKNYIANENVGIMTSALHIRRLFGECIRLGRSYANSKIQDELYEALRLLGTGLHCLEDFAAHSNYIELALIELGEHNVFPQVGNRTKIQIQGARDSVYPITTGTFGGVDFLHSVLGEFNDKATQSEIQELEGRIKQDSKGDFSLLKDLMGKIPKGVFEGRDQSRRADELKSNSANAQMNNLRVSPREPEEFTRQMQEMTRQIYPILEWHDDTMKSITKAIEKIPILPEIMSKLEEQLNIFVFSLIAPFLLPLINQVKNELNTGSSEIIQSSKEKQFIVFNDDYSSDPTHSMLSKDHFSNILNEPAGKIASEVLKWTVPQLMQCWDDASIDVDRTLNRIIHGAFNHPALRDYDEDGTRECRRIMFGVVENWWNSKDNREKNDLRQNLSRDGVKNGKNHEGTPDCGHGCGHPIKMNQKMGNSKHGSGASAIAFTGLSSVLAVNDSSSGGSSVGKLASKAAGGGVFGGFVGAIAGGIGGSLLSGGKRPKPQNDGSSDYTQQEDYKQSNDTSYGAEYQNTQSGNYKPQSVGSFQTNEYPKHSQQGSQYGGRTDEYQGYSNPTSQYNTSSDQYQGDNQSDSQYGGRTSQYQEYNKPTSQYNSISDQYQGNNQTGSQYESQSFGQQYENATEFGGRNDQSDSEGKGHRKHHSKHKHKKPEHGAQDEYNQSDSEGKGHRKHHSKHKHKKPEHGAQDEYNQSDYRDNSQNQQSYYNGRQDSYGRAEYGGNQDSRY